MIFINKSFTKNGLYLSPNAQQQNQLVGLSNFAKLKALQVSKTHPPFLLAPAKLTPACHFKKVTVLLRSSSPGESTGLSSTAISSIKNTKSYFFTNNASNKELNQSLIKILATQIATASLKQLDKNKNKYHRASDQFDAKDKELHQSANLGLYNDVPNSLDLPPGKSLGSEQGYSTSAQSKYSATNDLAGRPNTLQQKNTVFTSSEKQSTAVNTKQTNFLKNLTKYNYYYQTNQVHKSIEFLRPSTPSLQTRLDNKNALEETNVRGLEACEYPTMYSSLLATANLQTNAQSLQFLQKMMLIVLRGWNHQRRATLIVDQKLLVYSKTNKKSTQSKNFNLSNGYFNSLNTIKTGAKPWFNQHFGFASLQNHLEGSASGFFLAPLSNLSSSVGLAYFSQKKSFLSYWLIPFMGFYALVSNSTYADINVKAEAFTSKSTLGISVPNNQGLNNLPNQNQTSMLPLHHIWFSWFSLNGANQSLQNPSFCLTGMHKPLSTNIVWTGQPGQKPIYKNMEGLSNLEKLAIDYLKAHSKTGFITYQPQPLTILNTKDSTSVSPSPSEQIILTNHKIKKSNFLWYWNNINLLCSKDGLSPTCQTNSPYLSNNSNTFLSHTSIPTFNLFNPHYSNAPKMRTDSWFAPNHNYGLKTTDGFWPAGLPLRGKPRWDFESFQAPLLTTSKVDATSSIISQNGIVNTNTFRLLNRADKNVKLINTNKPVLSKIATAKLNSFIRFQSVNGFDFNTTKTGSLANPSKALKTKNFILVSNNNLPPGGATLYYKNTVKKTFPSDKVAYWSPDPTHTLLSKGQNHPWLGSNKASQPMNTPVTDYKEIAMFLDKLITNYNWSLVNQSLKNQHNNKLVVISGADFVIKPSSFKGTNGKALQTNLLFNNKFLFTLLNTKLTSKEFNTKNYRTLFGTVLNSPNQTNTLQSKRAFNSKLDSIYSFLVNTTLNNDFNKTNPVSFIKIRNPICTSSSLSALEPQGALTNSNLKISTKIVTTEALTKPTNYNPFLNQGGFSSSAPPGGKNNLTQTLTLLPTDASSPQNLDLSEGVLPNSMKQVLSDFSNLGKSNPFDVQNWVVIKTKLFNNYIKYIQFKIKNYIFRTKSWFTPSSTNPSLYSINQSFYPNTVQSKINSQNFKQILKKYLPSSNIFSIADLKEAKRNQRSGIKVDNLKTAIGSSKPLQNFLPKTVRINYNFTKAIQLVLKHKKFFKTKLFSPKPTAYQSIWFDPTINNNMSGFDKLVKTDQSYTNYMFSKKEMQQKRKAKKQRLESRRQKKRKRFYPRPTWLRLRLALKLTNTSKTLKGINNSNRVLLASKPLNLSGLGPYLLQSKKYHQVDSSKYKLTNVTKGKNQTLNSYINKLATNTESLNFKKLFWDWGWKAQACAPHSLLTNKVNGIAPPGGKNLMDSKFLEVKNINQNKNIVLNLWINAKKVKNLNQSFSPNPLLIKPNSQIGLLASATKNKFFTSKKALIYLKNINSKQYVNFWPAGQKPTNPTMPKKTESNRLREFWIWLYNTTSTNNWNKSFLNPLINQIGMPIKLKSLSSDNNQNKNLDASGNNLDKANFSGDPNHLTNNLNILPTNSLKSLNIQPNVQYLNWALNKTSYWSSTTKRFHLWTNQKLRNQSKNNKTKFIEKQLKNKFNTGLSSIYLKSLTKDYKTKVTPSPADKTDVLASNTFYKFKLSQKLHQKEQKLAYLATISTEDAKKPTIRAKNQLNNYSLNNNFISKPTVNLTWWNSGGSGLLSTNKKPASFLNLPPGGADNNQKLLPTNNTKVFQTYNITIIALLFHFCALISLISISQIRCFIKFHYILLTKLSNIYLQLIYKNLDLTKRVFSSVIQSKPYTSSLNNSLTKKTKTIAESASSYQTLGTVRNPFKKRLEHFQPSFSFTNLVPLTSLFLNSIMPKQFLSNIKKPQNKSLLENLNKTKIVNNLKKQNTLHFNQSGVPIYSSINKSNNTGFKYVPVRFFLATTKALTVNKNQNNKNQSTKLNKTNQNAKPIFNNIKDFNSFIKQLFILNQFTKQKNITKQILVNKTLNKQFNNTQQSQSLGFLNKKEFWPAGLSLGGNIKALYYQLELTEYTMKTTKAAQKFAVNTSYQVVDSFEYVLRIIYSFFEKPAEFTMDWVAYAFLVEWSSDLLAFTPEKTEKQLWLTFSKLSRQSKIWPATQGQKFKNVTDLQTLNSDGFIQFFTINSTITNSTLLLWNLIMGQLLYKRILYLNDMFLEILNRPDSDLVNRQKKGALFWDIWSDILIKAADKYNINVPSLSNIKEEQNVLIDKFLADNMLFNNNKKDVSLKSGTDTYSLGNSFKQNFYNKTNNFLKTKALLATSKYGRLSLAGKSGTSNEFQGDLLTSQHQQSSFLVNSNATDINQFVTYQSKENDLFLDYHPPKSFAHISAIRYYNLVQQPLGNIVCQIYSGLFTKQIAKNILVIGSTLNTSTNTALERTQKTLLIQALAGETEIKIITDNASRYAIVNRGFAVGIKLLKDVFEAISLNTPCFFLLEDIHLIGERRPLLISDSGSDNGAGDELSKSTDYTFGSQRNGEAVHEKNQILYQLNMHGITHYKKPFKGDFSLSIPTNHFTFDLFLKQATRNGTSTIPTHPLAYSLNSFEIDKITNPGQSNQNSEYSLTNTLQKLTSNRSTIATNFDSINKNTSLASSLQLASNNSNKLLSPPSTSPFTVLLLKEQKKLKPKKTVKELPWLGLSSSEQQLGSAATGTSRISYSVRAKVAALADLSFSNMSAKLDMITDLLVIIDSVRGNRGFVVFATTHLPHILDPALRRPGRLDETICIPTLSNIWTRWEFTKTTEPVLTGLNNFIPNLAVLPPHSGPTVNNLNILNSNNISNNFTLLANRFNFVTRSEYKTILGYNGTIDHLDFINLDFVSNQNTNIFSSIVTVNYSVKKQALRTKSLENYNTVYATNKQFTTNQQKAINFASLEKASNNTGLDKRALGWQTRNQPSHLLNSNTSVISKLSKLQFKKQLKQMFCISYNQIGKNLITNKYTFSLSTLTPSYYNPTTLDSTISLTETNSYLMNVLQYNSLYSSTNLIQNTISGLLSGKLSEGFVNSGVLKSLVLMSNSLKPKSLTSLKHSKGESGKNIKKTKSSTESVQYFVQKQKTKFPTLETSALQDRKSVSLLPNGKSDTYIAVQDIASNIINLYGIDQTWKAATSLALSFVQKRYLYNKNLIVPKLLNFTDYTSLGEPPSPPLSNILIPAKRYENAKKTLKENIERKVSSSIIEKLETHNKQAYIKSIYKTNKFQPNIVNTNALATLGNSKHPLTIISSANWHYQNKILKRHRNYLNNQWWNGQLTEHSSEALFLSDIDWRFTFIDNLNTSNVIKGPALDWDAQAYTSKGASTKQNQSSVQSKVNNFDKPLKDILIDFPDAEQHYNPKHRRWMLTYGTWNSWFSMDKNLQTEIFNHLIFESIVKSFSLLDHNRELLDYSVSKYMTKGLFKEFYLNNAIRKFSNVHN
jgi:hypothetical protein